MKPINELTIQDIVGDIFKTTSIKKKRKEIISFYAQQYDADLFGDIPDSECTADISVIESTIDSILKADRQDENPYLTYSKTYYRKAKRKTTPVGPLNQTDSNYTGKAGECLVMGELLFRGYNVNSMMVDEGIDLVASKANVFFYIQVKTKTAQETNRFYFQIKQERFDTLLGTQIRYILVARCMQKGEIKNIFFRFSNDDIQRFRFNGVIPMPCDNSTTLSIKIEYDDRTGKTYIYDGKNREDISFFTNNFAL